MSLPRSRGSPKPPLQPSPLAQGLSPPGSRRQSSRPAASPLPVMDDPEPPMQPSSNPHEHAIEDEHEQDHEQDHELDATLQQRPFQPFFTLVEDASTQTTLHPSVSYIFADDEHDPLTEAALHIQTRQSSLSVSALTSTLRPDASRRRPSQPQQDPRRRSSQIEPIERAILLTLTPSGRDIASFHSLTPDWHLDDVEVTAAPTLDGGSDGAGSPAVGSTIGTSPNTMANRLRRTSGTAADRLRVDEEREGLRAQREDGPLMLRLHGHGIMPGIGSDEALRLGLDGLREEYLGRMEELRRVVAAGEEDVAGWGLGGDGQVETG